MGPTARTPTDRGCRGRSRPRAGKRGGLNGRKIVRDLRVTGSRLGKGLEDDLRDLLTGGKGTPFAGGGSTFLIHELATPLDRMR